MIYFDGSGNLCDARDWAIANSPLKGVPYLVHLVIVQHIDEQNGEPQIPADLALYAREAHVSQTLVKACLEDMVSLGLLRPTGVGPGRDEPGFEVVMDVRDIVAA